VSEIIKRIGYTNVFARNRASKATVIINVGGARSSKSYSIAQLLIEKLITEQNKAIGVCRKTFPALRMTSMKLLLDLLKEYGIYREENHNKTFNTYTHGTNHIQFFGLDETEKVKSAEFNYIWMEEANEFSYEDYIALKLRLSGPTEKEQNHMYLSLNPVDAHNWIATRASKESDVEVIKSTYLDNPYLSQDYKDVLLDLINQDENAYRVYVLGEWGLLEGKIYTNYQVIPELPDMTGAKWVYGLDFGLTNPSAVVKVYLLDGKLYVQERLYRTGMTNADIIEFFSHEEQGDIYADPSAKQMIAEIQRAGYTAFPGVKGVKEGIDLCQRQTLLIPSDSPHLIKEIQNYHWKKDKNAVGGEAFLPEPVKHNDHLMDAMRYAIWGITERFGFATQRPRPMEPIRSLTFPGQERNKVLERWIRRVT
jgi:phage terminase large subunit